MSIAVPAMALAGTFAGYYLQSPHPDPVASSVASYDLHRLATGAGHADARAAGRLAASARRLSATAKPTTTAPVTTKQAASPAPSATTTPATVSTAPTCSGTGGVAGTGLLPANYATIVNFLVAHGYTKLAAVGIAGNIYQESKGDPESVGTGGGGLIGWTPLPAGYVTGNLAADLQTQLSALLAYNQQWAQYIPMLNAATTPTDAADIYMNYFERPGIPAASNREGAAVAVAQACGIG